MISTSTDPSSVISQIVEFAAHAVAREIANNSDSDVENPFKHESEMVVLL